jgi:heme-degrading monooxygenase HmoA
MIARTWRGWTVAADADRYVEYLNETGVRAFHDAAGCRGAFVLRRIVQDRAEFVVLSLWDSMESVRGFSGSDERVAVFYPEDDAFLVERERHADHFEVVVAPEALAGASRETGEP